MLSESPAFVRRCLRFLALPHCYFFYINWKACEVGRLQAIYDLFYIFFRLKFFPENYSLCRLWEKRRSEWKYYYGSVYDALQRSRLRKEVFPIKYRIIFDDKNICYQLCVANNLPVPLQYNLVQPSEFKTFLSNLFAAPEMKSQKVIIKPLSGRGGKNIHIGYYRKGSIYLKGNDNKELPLNQFSLPALSVVQQYIQQHPKLRQISQSVNTIRIVTLLTQVKEVLIIGAFMRFGVQNVFLDNTSQGGIKVCIDVHTGKFLKYGHDKKSHIYEAHPISGFCFEGFQIPFWKEVVQLAHRVQKTFVYNKIIGQDIAITANGPTIIELNAEYDNIGLEQVCGPILRDSKVLKAFDDYGLLYNDKQRSLLKAFPRSGNNSFLK
ncbi:hypothetical protein HNR65_003355 [Desulfosalsimonas propionicica]|uniref:Alpha-L-glutamate ligase-related protein ATP-grasp domain-containing protein n=1 Tax=Desulfosalsimonas propionicica TaxID=332175 RepID=A0A7W0CC59_9BACT|nr:sugar-transfer associated ATP-grasp domain-containing protein [Desulfosalsimonas propionicica]MBA2882998.1 hypothetical protein [Desulfosalsimonas propionicica]